MPFLDKLLHRNHDGAASPEPPRGLSPRPDSPAALPPRAASPLPPRSASPLPPRGASPLPSLENPRTSSADYKPVRILGQGKEGQVFLARSLKDGREVAIKQINRREKGISSLFHSKEHKLEKEQSISDHVHGEVEILKRINHPHMIRLLDCYQTRDKWCLVFELATGGELHDRIYADYTPHGFNERHAAYIIATLCNALRFLHDLHICHRDMKAANVMFRGEGKSSIVLVDFGIARTLANDDRQKEMMLSTQTGTLAYIAPEIIRGKGYGKAVDCWSLGVITYELVSGVQPWLDLDGTQSLLERILTSDFDFPTEFFESVSKTAQNFILRFMQADPNKRMTMAQAMEHPWIKSMVSPYYLEGLADVNRRAKDWFERTGRGECPPEIDWGPWLELDVEKLEAERAERQAREKTEAHAEPVAPLPTLIAAHPAADTAQPWRVKGRPQQARPKRRRHSVSVGEVQLHPITVLQHEGIDESEMERLFHGWEQDGPHVEDESPHSHPSLLPFDQHEWELAVRGTIDDMRQDLRSPSPHPDGRRTSSPAVARTTSPALARTTSPSQALPVGLTHLGVELPAAPSRPSSAGPAGKNPPERPASRASDNPPQHRRTKSIELAVMMRDASLHPEADKLEPGPEASL